MLSTAKKRFVIKFINPVLIPNYDNNAVSIFGNLQYCLFTYANISFGLGAHLFVKVYLDQETAK